MILPLLAAGCASVPADDLRALCDGTAEMRAAHAAALLNDGGDESVVTGARLIVAVDSACPDEQAGK